MTVLGRNMLRPYKNILEHSKALALDPKSEIVDSGQGEPVCSPYKTLAAV